MATALPMPDDMIEWIDQFGHKQKANPGLVFVDHNINVMNEYYEHEKETNANYDGYDDEEVWNDGENNNINDDFDLDDEDSDRFETAKWGCHTKYW